MVSWNAIFLSYVSMATASLLKPVLDDDDDDDDDEGLVSSHPRISMSSSSSSYFPTFLSPSLLGFASGLLSAL